MKTRINLLTNVKNDGRTTVNRRSTDGQSQRHYTLGLMKYAAIITLLLTLACGNVWGANGDVLFNQGFGSATEVAYSENTTRSYSTSSTLSGLVGTGDNLFQGAQCNNKTSCGIAINTTSGANSYTTAGTFQAYANNTSFKWALYKTTNFATTAPTAIKFEMDVTPKYIDKKQALAVVVGSGFSVGTSKPGWTAGYTGFNIITNSSSTGKIYIGKVGGTTSIQTTTGMTSGTNYHITWVINATGDDLTYTGPDSKSYTLATAKWDMWVGTTRIISGQDRTKTGGTDFSGTTMQNLYIGNDVSGKHEVIIDNVKVTDLTPDPCDAADLTASNITSNGDQEAGTGITFSKVGTPASGDTWYWQTSATGTDKTYNASSAGYTTATTAGSYTVYLRAFNTDCWGEAASMTNTIYPAPSAMIHNTFAVNAAWGSTIATQDKTNITGLNAMAAVGESVGSGSNKSGLTQTIPSQSSEDADKYMSLSFNVASGKQLNVTSVVFDEQPVTSTGTFKVSISDNQGSATKTQTIASDAAGSKHTLTLDGDIVGSFKGTVTVKVWAYGWSDGYRFGDYFYINGTVTAAAACTAPDHVDISGDWDKFGGETISLTATAYSSAGTGSPIADGNITGWQWQKLVGSTWTNVTNGTADGVTTSGATTKNLQISNCGQGNSGKYRCVVSTGETCLTASATATDGSEGYVVKVYALECYTGGTTVYNFTRDGNNQRGSVSIALTASTGYEFKIHADKYYGNNGTINFDENNWTFTAAGNNVTVNSGLGGTFTFTIDYSSNGDVPVLAVTYPRKRIYLEPNSDWLSNSAKFAYYYFHKTGDDTDAEGWTDFLTADDCGRYADIPQWNGVQMIAVRFNSTKTSTGNWDDKWNQTDDITVTANDLITITGWNNSQTYNSTYSTPTYTISYNAGTGGSGSKSNETKTCGVAFTLPNSAVFTRTGYTQTGWTTSDGGAQEYALGGTYTTNEDKTFYPVWTVNNYDLTWNLGGGTTTSTGTGIASGVSVNTTTSQAFGTALSAPTVTKTGYNFSAWSPAVASTMPAANTTYTAQWTVKTTTITIDANSGNHGSTTPGSVTATYGSALPSFTAAAGVSGYSLTGYFTTATSGTKVINADGTLVASTDYADGSGNWNSEAATLTLYAQYEEEVSCPSSGTLYSAAVKSSVSSNQSFAANATTEVNTSTQADITGGKLYAINGESSAKNLIANSSGYKFCMTNNSTRFKIEMDCALQEGDIITIDGVGGTKNDAPMGLWVSSSESRPGSAPACVGTSTTTSLVDDLVNYTVTSSDEYHGKTILYIHRAVGSSTYFNNINISRPLACSTPASPSGLTNGATTANTQVVTWTANGEDTWEVYYSTSSSTPGTDQTPTATVTSATYTFTGLTASTTYYWWVRSKCDASHKSAWVAGSSFETSAAAATPILSWALATNSSSWTATPTNNDETNLTNVATSTEHADIQSGATSGKTCKISLSSSATPDKYVTFTFKVACGKKLTPSSVWMEVANVGGSSGGKMTHKAEFSDNFGHTISATVVPASDGVLNELNITNGGGTYFQGDVTLKVWAWNSSGTNGTAFRMGPDVKIFGEVGSQATPAATITWNTQPANGQVGDPDFAYDVTCSDGSSVTVTSANTTYATIVGGKLHYAAAGTTHLVASATDACGNTVTPVNSNDFTVSAAAPTHDVTFSLTDVVYSSGDNQGTGAATEGSAFSTVFAASSGYSLPGTITVTIGGVEQTVGTGYTWAQGTGTLTIPAAKVTGDIVVTIVGEEIEGDGCEELVHTEAATAATLTTTVGTATLTNPSSQTANDKAIKLNSSGYIELSPKAGKSFAAGDSLIIVMWNQASSAKTTGYRIAGTDYTASMPSKVNTTFRRKLIAADIVSSKVKIERESDNGSNAYFVSAIIKHCEDLPSCTTPTLPTLSNQTVCPGNDIAAWDATPTNIATITGASEDVAYSWKKKGSDTELAATASFDLGSSATEGMAGTYVVTVTVSKTGYISKSASAEVDLTVTPATETPSVTASKAKVYATDEVTLTATCGSTGVTWNWYLCANSDGTGAGSSLGTSSTYTIASAPAAGTYYYKAVATGDGTHSCGAAEYVYTLVVSAANSCDKEFWFAKEADRPTGAAAATHITGCPSGSSSASYTASIDGTNYTLTGSTGQKTGNVTIVVPADNTGTLYVVVQGSSSRTITLSKGGTQKGQETPENSTWGVFTFDDLDAGTYNLVSSGNISWAMMALKLCPTVACTDDTPTAAATNATVCAGGTITITATGYEAGATFQWQKQNASTSVWENIDGATSDTYTVATAAAEHAGNYHIVATKGCARTSNTVTIAVPSAPVFNSFTTTRRIMETQALAINDVSATDAVSYTWYKSADATWDAGDEEVGTSKNLLKPYAGETAGSTYYVICRAANSCGTTTSSTITVTVQTLVEEDCAIVGNSGEHNTFAKTGSVSSGTYGSITELHTNSNNKYIYYTAESGYYFAKATVNACVGNASDLPTAAYSYSTDGGTNWTDQNLTGMTTAYADHVINLPANVNAFRVGRRLGDCGTSSNTIYIHQVCFTYNENCTKTTVDPSSSSVDYEIGDSFTEPTFTVKSSGVALSPQPTITYTSSDETVATVDDDGSVNFQDKAGTVVITASYAGDATYCSSEGSYTITVSCSDEAPRIIAAEGTNLGGCNDNITLEAKKQDGTTNFSDGTYQWYRDGEAISGATGRTYTVSLTGVYSVERTSVGGCVSPSSNKATVTSESAEPEVERLTPFQYYHVDKVYAETSIMRFRHLFAVKNAGTTLEGKHFKMELSRNGGAATDVTNSNAFVMNADTVLMDMNKLYGKYEEDDELVLTCSAVDCEGNVSSIYKNTITIYVIDETPTLALICSGADGDGTRSTKKLVVGGDFLTGYNKADLCVQTGNTSFDKTQEWVLYTRLKENYIVTPVNGYAEFNKLNYEPFDILFLTDYPKASKSDAAATILDDMADLCDYRPLFTFKTHMVAKSPSKWAAKGFMAQPEVPKQSRLRLNIVCYAHPMFEDLKETSDHIQKDAGDHSQIVYTMLAGAGHEGGKGMQGFPIDAAEGFVTIGLVHYDATAADDTPSDGYVTWTPGSNDVMMVAAAERQVNVEARMILFSVNCGAQSMLTETGRQVVLKSLEYLLSDATITPVADCSFTFTNGVGNTWTYEQYKAACPACTGTIGDGKWSTAGNWGPDWVLQPGKDTEVKIAAPVTVDMLHAKARAVRIIEGGSINIPAGSGLEVGSTIRRQDGTEISPTEVSDVTVGTSTTGNGTLILNNNAEDTKATVWTYSKGFIEDGVKNYQYIGTPFNEVNALYNYYGSWIYSWGTKKNGNLGWVAVKNGGPMHAWTGYCISQEAPTYYETRGTLTATNTVDIAVPAGNNMVVGNSWTAPIDINALTTDDLEGLVANIYFFNTGVDKKGTAGAAGSRYAGGTYVTVPVEAARYEGEDDHINSMQGFFVKNTSGSDGALHLDYDRHVRGTTRGSIIGDALHAPARRAALDSNEPEVLKIKVSGENYDDKLLLLAREDFTEGFDNGWDGDKWDGNESSLYIYTTDSEGTENSVSAVPELEGTIIGFRAGEDDAAYTLHFECMNSDETLFLYDSETNMYTQILNGATYRFFTNDNEKHARFIITRNSHQISTDIGNGAASDGAKVKKFILSDKMYIMINGLLYDATGKLVK